ncbi:MULTISPECIES: polyprenyl synthetase family protein [unclassified Leucobacter]|uniref:polyprenyl synthetase family protein n=1 Tax=unclassified Leucobacter TaxID=2621730 RepID=UPI00165DC898|nr:polyprenyl synthetase family protein [Leucobacter sp. CX169]MBC9926934.1 polyprenyl synthetase family protein [Leucobacter sp. cx-169]MBC9935104.1 polyprenyl synthetase family protein [Leucobacter sp. cx-87]
MHETTRLAGLLQERISDRIADHRRDLEPLGPDAVPLLDEAASFLTGGKRFRAQFAVLGYRAITPLELDGETISPELDLLLDAACSLELFHAAALIHDDIIDRSDTRRGRPSAHRHFAALHSDRRWSGLADHFGVAAAILLGDLLQSWADEMMQGALDAIPDRAAAKAARAHFNRMRSEVAVGQYLDVLEEQQPHFADDAEQLERSTRVLVYKSAKYSVEAPLLIGAAIAGASDEQEEALADFGLPIGVAFQLRDDVLGVFGDETLTGKPSGDDLTEGKRTVLVTLARGALPSGPRRIFDDMHGTPDLDREQIVMMQRTIRDSGALDRVEEMIAQNVALAGRTIQLAPIQADAADELGKLATRTSLRHA